MSKTISLNSEVNIDLPKLIEGGMVILANSGGGKSYAIRRIAEQAVKNVQVILLDPEGEFASLRTKYDFILAGKDADVPVEVRSAGLLATKLLQLGTSAVVDLYELHPQERQRFVKLFCEALVNCPKDLYHPVLIVLDEAHEYVPEGKPSEATWAVESLASKGRKRGQRLILASQRISKLSKNAAAECNNKLIGRASQDIDMKRAGDELGFNKENIRKLRQLKPGEFFAFGPAISDDVTKIKVGKVQTAHAKVSYKGNLKTPPPTAAIKKILGELKDLPEEAQKQSTNLKEAKAEITRLRKHRCPKVDIDQNSIDKAVKKAEMDKERQFASERNGMIKATNNYLKIIVAIGKTVAPHLEDRIEIASTPIVTPPIIIPRPKPESMALPPMSEQTFIEDLPLGRGEMAILNAIAQYPEGITNEHIAILTGYKKTSRRTYLQKLVLKNCVLLEGGNYIATEGGIETLGDSFEPLPTGPDLLNHWLQKLPEGEKKILIAISESQEGMTRTEIEEATDYKKTSVRTYVQKLMARKILKNEGDAVTINGNLL